MRKRLGFVSNSSSSSFVIKLKDISGEQLEKILNNKEAIEAGWSFSVEDSKVEGYVTIDNYSMHDFLQEINVPERVIEWEEF